MSWFFGLFPFTCVLVFLTILDTVPVELWFHKMLSASSFCSGVMGTVTKKNVQNWKQKIEAEEKKNLCNILL